MASRRITLRVPEDLAAHAKKAAGKRPVSAWITELIEERLETAELEREWQAFYRTVAPQRAPAASLAREDVRRADAMFARLTKPSRTVHE